MIPKGFKHSEETKQLISQKLTGRKLSEETKRKISLSQKGRPFMGKRNYKMSEEAKANIRKGIVENRYTEEYAKKLSERKQGSKNHRAKLTEKDVIEIRRLFETGNWTHQAIADKYKVGRGTVSDIIKGRTWKHVE